MIIARIPTVVHISRSSRGDHPQGEALVSPATTRCAVGDRVSRRFRRWRRRFNRLRKVHFFSAPLISGVHFHDPTNRSRYPASVGPRNGDHSVLVVLSPHVHLPFFRAPPANRRAAAGRMNVHSLLAYSCYTNINSGNICNPRSWRPVSGAVTGIIHRDNNWFNLPTGLRQQLLRDSAFVRVSRGTANNVDIESTELLRIRWRHEDKRHAAKRCCCCCCQLVLGTARKRPRLATVDSNLPGTASTACGVSRRNSPA